MRLLVIGGTRGAGLAFVVAARAAGHEVLALARSNASAAALQGPGAIAVSGDAMVKDDLSRLLALGDGASAVISFLGGTLEAGGIVDRTGNCLAIDAAAALGPYRFILVTSLGCGDSLPLLPPNVRQRLGPILLAKTDAEEHIRRSSLTWTIVRPGWLYDGPATGRGRLVVDPTAIGRIARCELASLLIRAVADSGTRETTFAAVEDPA